MTSCCRRRGVAARAGVCGVRRPPGLTTALHSPLPGRASGVEAGEAVGLMAEVALFDPRRPPDGDPLCHAQEVPCGMTWRRLVALCAIGRARRGVLPTRHGPVLGGMAGLAGGAEAAAVWVLRLMAGSAVEAVCLLPGQRGAGRSEGRARVLKQALQRRQGAARGLVRPASGPGLAGNDFCRCGGPQVPGSYSAIGAVSPRIGSIMRHVASTFSLLVNSEASPRIAALSKRAYTD